MSLLIKERNDKTSLFLLVYRSFHSSSRKAACELDCARARRTFCAGAVFQNGCGGGGISEQRASTASSERASERERSAEDRREGGRRRDLRVLSKYTRGQRRGARDSAEHLGDNRDFPPFAFFACLCLISSSPRIEQGTVAHARADVAIVSSSLLRRDRQVDSVVSTSVSF